MSRHILCAACGDKWQMHLQDVRDGWQFRKVHLSVRKPAVHEIVISGDSVERKSVPLDAIQCDLCRAAIEDGTVAHAVSMWRVGVVLPWEHEYGTILPPEAAKMERTLTKDKV